jgi:tripartite-type tricarboxylate transporter receptor subunit TctC
MDASNYWVLVAPAATPIELRRRLRDAVARVMAEQPLAGRLAELGFDTIANQPEVQEAQIRRMVAEWIELVRAANIRPDP